MPGGRTRAGGTFHFLMVAVRQPYAAGFAWITHYVQGARLTLPVDANSAQQLGWAPTTRFFSPFHQPLIAKTIVYRQQMGTIGQTRRQRPTFLRHFFRDPRLTC